MSRIPMNTYFHLLKCALYKMRISIALVFLLVEPHKWNHIVCTWVWLFFLLKEIHSRFIHAIVVAVNT